VFDVNDQKMFFICPAYMRIISSLRGERLSLKQGCFGAVSTDEAFDGDKNLFYQVFWCSYLASVEI
jgi:hypothetical protein